MLLLLNQCERYYSPFVCDRFYIHLHDRVNGVRVFLSITGASFIFPVWQVLLSFYLCGRSYFYFTFVAGFTVVLSVIGASGSRPGCSLPGGPVCRQFLCPVYDPSGIPQEV